MNNLLNQTGLNVLKFKMLHLQKDIPDKRRGQVSALEREGE